MTNKSSPSTADRRGSAPVHSWASLIDRLNRARMWREVAFIQAEIEKGNVVDAERK